MFDSKFVAYFIKAILVAWYKYINGGDVDSVQSVNNKGFFGQDKNLISSDLRSKSASRRAREIAERSKGFVFLNKKVCKGQANNS